MKDIRTLPAPAERVESGALRFGKDFPGVFIRHDDAANFAYHLERYMKGRRPHNEITAGVVQGLLDMLRTCDLMLRWTEHEKHG